MVRVYLRERGRGVRELMHYLREESGVRGVTMFRGVMGFGADRQMHGASLSDLSLDLPVVVEFFDAPERVAAIVAHLEQAHRAGSHRLVACPRRRRPAPDERP